jgi:hypothetical protein
MDPFLEHPDVFPDFQYSFIAYLREAIQQRLPVAYIAGLGRRAWIEVSEHDERHEAYIEIFVGRGTKRRLVTAIEVLSLTNKTPGEHGRDLYLRKQREILESRVHLVEIDLLRAGEPTTAVPVQRLLDKVGSFDYQVCMHHFDNLEDYFVYPVRLAEPLPEIEIPLLPGDAALSVDLQAVFSRTYDAGPYGREIDYGRDPVVPALDRDQEAWLRAAIEGRRSN